MFAEAVGPIYRDVVSLMNTKIPSKSDPAIYKAKIEAQRQYPVLRSALHLDQD